MPYPGLLHLERLPLQQATAEPYLYRRHSATVLAQSLWVGSVIFALSRSEQLRVPGAWLAHFPRWAVYLNHLPGPGHLVSQLHHESTVRCAVCLLWGADLRL